MIKKLTKLIICLISFFLIGCATPYSKAEFYLSDTIKDDLYLEMYIDGGGAHSSNRYYYFITDSTNFKVYVGNHDDDGRIYVGIFNQEILYVNKYNDAMVPIYDDSTTYKIKDLIKEGKLDKPL